MYVSFDYYKQLESPVMYLCNPNKKYITAIDANDRHLILRFNDISELSFSVTYSDKTSQYFNLIETKRLVFIEGIGWFQITSVQEDDSGTSKAKSVTAQSHQYSLKDRGFVSENRVYMFYNPLDPYDKKYESSNLSAIPSIVGQLCKQLGFKLDLTYEEEKKEDAANWTIIYINKSLYFHAVSDSLMYTPNSNETNICRTMDEDLESNGYDFIRNKVQEGFEVIFEFDFLYHTIKIKTLEEITSPTNIYLSFDNVINTISVSEKAEDIVTVMSCSGGDGLDIRTVNPMGTNYIVNFDYYKKERSENGELDYPWLSKEAIEALNLWEETFNSWQNDDENRDGHKKGFTTIVKELQEKYIPYNKLNTDITNHNLKLLDLQTVRDQYVSEEIKGDEILTAESWKLGEKSLYDKSAFYDKPFSDNTSITGYVSAPEYTNDKFEFSSSVSGSTGAINQMILNYIEDAEEDEEEGNPIYLYFIDASDQKSYCKLLVSSEVGIVKNADGEIDENGIVKFDTTVFTVETSTEFFKITTEQSGVLVVNRNDPYFNYDGKRYKIIESADKIVTIYYYYVSGFTRFTTCSQVNTWYTLWQNYINTVLGSISAIKSEIDVLEEELSYISAKCNIESFFKDKSENLYEELLNYWIEGEYENDKISVTDSTTMSERIDLAKELMEAGEKDLAKNSQPQFEMTVDSINFVKLFEFKQFADQLELGRTITIEKDDNTYYRPALLSIEYDLDGTDNFSLTFSNAVAPTNTTMTIADLLNETSSTSRKVAANWSNLIAYSNDKGDLYNIIIDPLDSALKSLKKDMVDQETIIDSSGYLGRKKITSDEAETTFSPEQIRIINNTILFTEDGWETASLALGKTEYGYGLVADVLVGELILGQRISIGSNSERVTINGNGIVIKNDDGENVFLANEEGDLTIKGTIYATDGTFNGKITAASGEIGGYRIGDKALTSQNVGMSSDSTDGAFAFWAGNGDAAIAPFSVTNDGSIVATKGNIGNLTIGGGNLYSQNFKIETISCNGEIRSWLKFYDTNNEETTSISDKDVNTKNISALDEITGNIISGNSINVSDGVSLHGMSITGNKTFINFGLPGEVTDYTATLTYPDSTLVVTLDKPLQFSKSFAVTLKAIWGSGYYTTWVTVPSGATKGVKDVSAFFGIENAYFQETKSKSYSFIQYISAPQIGIGGALIAQGDSKVAGARDIGTQLNPWNTAYFVNGAQTVSDIKFKYSVEDLDNKFSRFFDLLRPVSYKLNLDKENKIHIGFIANEIEEALGIVGIDKDYFGAYQEAINEEGEVERGLRYEEFIALNTLQIQQLKDKIRHLEAIIAKYNKTN